MTLKIRILRLFKISVNLTMTLFNEKMLISTRCIYGYVSNLIKKSWTVSTHPIISPLLLIFDKFCYFPDILPDRYLCLPTLAQLYYVLHHFIDRYNFVDESWFFWSLHKFKMIDDHARHSPLVDLYLIFEKSS